jgi:hypothetical protein
MMVARFGDRLRPGSFMGGYSPLLFSDVAGLRGARSPR